MLKLIGLLAISLFSLPSFARPCRINIDLYADTCHGLRGESNESYAKYEVNLKALGSELVSITSLADYTVITRKNVLPTGPLSDKCVSQFMLIDSKFNPVFKKQFDEVETSGGPSGNIESTGAKPLSSAQYERQKLHFIKKAVQDLACE
jgi:hypothetical protein